MKDLFSGHASDYSRYRPTYPGSLFSWLSDIAPQHEQAWDCATGNGQAALALVPYFKRIAATDLSEQQIAEAPRDERIRYSVATAEKSGLPDQSVDLITVAQAFHWFDQQAFFKEAERVLKPGGILAIWCYSLNYVTAPVDRILRDFYNGELQSYWDPERALVDEHYRSVELPFTRLPAPDFRMETHWGLEDYLGYLKTWSGVKKFQKTKGFDPIEQMRPLFAQAWGDPKDKRTVHFPLGLKVSRR